MIRCLCAQIRIPVPKEFWLFCPQRHDLRNARSRGDRNALLRDLITQALNGGLHSLRAIVEHFRRMKLIKRRQSERAIPSRLAIALLNADIESACMADTVERLLKERTL